MAVLQLQMNKNLFLRDPQETEIGRRIIQMGITMIDEMGIENFTFKKLAQGIESTEATIYRYFENKHKLLVYLISWYWNWLEYKIDFGTQNIEDPKRKLEIAIKIVGEKKYQDPSFPQVDEVALSRVVIAESDKAYLTKQVDEDNSDGLFRGFKSLCKMIASFVKEINPDYQYPNALVSTMLESAHQQLFFANHLPSLTELSERNEDIYKMNIDFLTKLVLNNLKSPQNV